MKVKKLPLEGAFEIAPTIHEDDRGFFFEWFNQARFKELTNSEFTPVQFNCSKSSKGVLRGLHFQLNPHAQAKLITATKGEIQDVIVDVRDGSETFGQHYSTILSADNKNQLFIPRGFAHGFLVLSEEAEIFYAIDSFYAPDFEGGIRHNDPALGIQWMAEEKDLILSERDKTYDAFNSVPLNF